MLSVRTPTETVMLAAQEIDKTLKSVADQESVLKRLGNVKRFIRSI